MVHPRSGERVACPAGIEQKLRVTNDQANKMTEWSGYLRMREDRDPTLLEYCVKQYELFFGYIHATDDLVYVNPAYKWSVSYPRNWVLDSRDLALVKLEPSSQLPWGLVGIRSEDAAGRSLEEYTEAFLDKWNRGLRRQGSSARVLSQQHRQLLDGTPTVEVVHRLGAGRMGQSRKLIALRDGRGLVIDAETFLEAWPVLAPYFEWIISSFTVQ
jgi:hypothetical protein